MKSLPIILIIAFILSGCGTTKSVGTTTETTNETVTTKETQTVTMPRPVIATLPTTDSLIHYDKKPPEPVVTFQQKEKGKPTIKGTYYPERRQVEIEVQPESTITKTTETVTTTQTDRKEEVETKSSSWTDALFTPIGIAIGIAILFAVGYAAWRFKK